VRTDIAVLKIDATNLVPITFSNSDQLRAGDVVIAVGNPFGLTRSATMGVVSAVGRNSQMSQLADLGNFIQTDAAINMGNSGGALVDYLGRLVGINTAIFSRSGGNQGIGFSVPANMARSVMESLIKHGRVLRGFLGIGLQDVDEALQKEFNVEPGSGALITEVQANSPAVKAGLREYDVVTGVNGKKVEGVQDLRLTVASMLPGAKVTLQVIRDRKNMDVTVQLGEKPEKREAQPVVKEADPDVLDGVTVADLDDNNRQEFKVPANIKGAMVTAVEADSIAATAGIRPGDVIQEVKRRPISSADEAVKLSEELKKEKQVLLRVYTRGGSRLLMLESKP
jgi:serine protease Do